MEQQSESPDNSAYQWIVQLTSLFASAIITSSMIFFIPPKHVYMEILILLISAFSSQNLKPQTEL